MLYGDGLRYFWTETPKSIAFEHGTELLPLMDLIDHRNTIIRHFETTGGEIQTLNGVLRWNSPEKEYPPAEPEMLRNLRELLHPQPVVWRG